MSGETLKVDLPPGPESSARARRAVREICGGTRVDLDAVVLCASEIVTNALLHGRPPIQLEIRAAPDSVWVAVHDAGDGTVEPRRPATADTSSGRGLQILETVASRWGTSSRGEGKTIWFECDTK